MAHAGALSTHLKRSKVCRRRHSDAPQRDLNLSSELGFGRVSRIRRPSAPTLLHPCAYQSQVFRAHAQYQHRLSSVDWFQLSGRIPLALRVFDSSRHHSCRERRGLPIRENAVMPRARKQATSPGQRSWGSNLGQQILFVFFHVGDNLVGLVVGHGEVGEAHTDLLGEHILVRCYSSGFTPSINSNAR